MYLWNYISSELAENGQPATTSIGYYDESDNVILFTVNENKWQVKAPAGINTREAMILFMTANVPVLKEFIDGNDTEILFNPSIEDMVPPSPAAVIAQEEAPAAPIEEAPVVQPVAVPSYEEDDDDEIPVTGQPDEDDYYEAAPVAQPEPAPYYEVPVAQPEPEISQPVEMKIVRCEKCGLFYDSAAHLSCPFCKNEEAPVIESPADEFNVEEPEAPAQINNEAETIIDLSNNDVDDIDNIAFAPIPSFSQTATVNFYINDGLYSSVSATDGEEISLGRADFCTIFCAEEKQLSRVHCTIQYNAAENTFCIKDKSLNGIFDFTGSRLPKDTAVIVPAGTRLWVATKAMMIEFVTNTASAPEVPSQEEPAFVPVQPAARNVCNACGGEYGSDALFCPWCGNKLTV